MPQIEAYCSVEFLLTESMAYLLFESVMFIINITLFFPKCFLMVLSRHSHAWLSGSRGLSDPAFTASSRFLLESLSSRAGVGTTIC